MSVVRLPAHFDGNQILLDEPYNLEPNTKLIVTVLSGKKKSNEHKSWYSLSKKGLEKAYSDDEPDYSSNLIKENRGDGSRGCISRL